MGDIHEILGRSVLIRSTDDGYDEIGAVVRNVDWNKRALVLTLTQTLYRRDQSYRHAVAISRQQRDNIETLLTGGLLCCAVTYVPADRFNESSPIDLSWWRGGGATIADVIMKPLPVHVDHIE